jgi:CRP-like cAMP-binding protein
MEKTRIVPLADRSPPKNRLLAALQREDIERFFSSLQPVSITLRQVLCEVGAPLEQVYFIEEGVASVLTAMTGGSKIEVGMIGFDGIVGVDAVLGAEISAHQVIVQVAGTALRMDTAVCKDAFERSASVRAVVLRFAVAMLNLAAQTAACNAVHSIEQRCARWLLMACDRARADVIPMTHEFLSTMLGVRRAGVTEIAAKLQRLGLIRYHHGHVTIVDRDRLGATACACWQIDHDRFQRRL